MKAALFYGIQDMRVEEIARPVCGPDDILMEVRAAAICGTDMRIYHYGHFKIKKDDRRVLSHEVSGEVAEIGKRVTGFQVGDRVSVIPNIGCGTCPNCRKGLNQLCPDYDAFGINLDGGFAEYMKIPAPAIRGGNVVRLPESITYEEAALIEPLSCCYNSWRTLGTHPGDNVLIIGAGPIGALHVMMNRLAGATQIIVADIMDARLAQVKELGADIVINSTRQDLKTEVEKLTDGQGISVVITACSVPAMQQLALELAAVEGRINLFGGMPKGKEQVTLNTNLIHYKQLRVLGTTGSTVEDYRESMKIVSSGRLEISRLVCKRFKIDEMREALQYAASGEGMKTLIVFGES